MSLTTQSFNHTLNNIEEQTKFIQNRATNIINNTNNNFNKDDIFIIFTMFAKGFFATYLLPETEFQYAVLFDPYALNITVLAVTRGETLINDVNQTKALTPKTYQSVTLNVTEHEKEQLLTVYGDTTAMKKYLLDSFDLLLTDAQYEQLTSAKEKECIANLKREKDILKNQVGYHQSRANDNANKVNTLSITKSVNVRKLSKQQEEIYQLKRELDIYKNQHVLSDNEQSIIKLQLALSELQEQNKQLKNHVRELNQRNDQTLETSDKRRRLLKKARQTMKKTITQLKNHKQKPYKILVDELTDVIDDTYLYS
mgnify:CR=1 FL=1